MKGINFLPVILGLIAITSVSAQVQSDDLYCEQLNTVKNRISESSAHISERVQDIREDDCIKTLKEIHSGRTYNKLIRKTCQNTLTKIDSLNKTLSEEISNIQKAMGTLTVNENRYKLSDSERLYSLIKMFIDTVDLAYSTTGISLLTNRMLWQQELSSSRGKKTSWDSLTNDLKVQLDSIVLVQDKLQKVFSVSQEYPEACTVKP